ncbi:MAG: tetratricopeptide repeat protein [bacterium]|nr:MAG: tetratricopeptide repeat protein [bacterium]
MSKGKITATAVAAFLILLSPAGLHAQGELSLQLESAGYDMAIREPLKFTVTLKNISEREVRVIEVGKLDMNMEFMHLEITTPDGETQLRKFTRFRMVSIVNPNYEGEPLSPGESIETFIYPNVTHHIVGTPRGGVTFPAPGTYKVRLVYSIPEHYPRLWRGQNGELYSNSIELRLREPDEIEREIMDAYWAEGGYAISKGDDNLGPEFDEYLLRAVMEKYPDHPFMKYIRFALAIELMDKRDLDSVQEVSTLLEDMRYRYPGHRDIEVRQHLATAYHLAGETDEAVRLLDDLLEEYPLLESHYNFMVSKIFVETGSYDGVLAWREARKTGRTEPGGTRKIQE